MKTSGLRQQIFGSAEESREYNERIIWLTRKFYTICKRIWPICLGKWRFKTHGTHNKEQWWENLTIIEQQKDTRIKASKQHLTWRDEHGITVTIFRNVLVIFTMYTNLWSDMLVPVIIGQATMKQNKTKKKNEFYPRWKCNAYIKIELEKLLHHCSTIQWQDLLQWYIRHSKLYCIFSFSNKIFMLFSTQ